MTLSKADIEQLLIWGHMIKDEWSLTVDDQALLTRLEEALGAWQVDEGGEE